MAERRFSNSSAQRCGGAISLWKLPPGVLDVKHLLDSGTRVARPGGDKSVVKRVLLHVHRTWVINHEHLLQMLVQLTVPSGPFGLKSMLKLMPQPLDLLLLLVDIIRQTQPTRSLPRSMIGHGNCLVFLQLLLDRLDLIRLLIVNGTNLLVRLIQTIYRRPRRRSGLN